MTPSPFQLIDTDSAFQDFVALHQEVEWLGFDTEFIGENRLIPLLCLIQISSLHGIFLIDTLRLEDISPLLALFENASILKITHAGNNDYALLHSLYKVRPENIFDVQIAAGFAGYSFPVSFQKLVKQELGINLNKITGVTNWKVRPLSKKQLNYAADDVRYLKPIYDRLYQKLKQRNRLDWAREEFDLMLAMTAENPDWREEFLQYKQNVKLSSKEVKVVLQILRWREEQARANETSKEAAFPYKMIYEVARNIKATKKEIAKHRVLSRKRVLSNWNTFRDFYEHPKLSEEEAAMVARVRRIKKKTEQENLRFSFLKLMIKQRCYEAGVPEALVINGMGMNNPLLDNFPASLRTGWRSEVLGPTLVDWMATKAPLSFEFKKEQCIVRRQKIEE